MAAPAILGYGHTSFTRRYTEDASTLAAQAVLAACEDAGVPRTALDGLVLARSPILPATEFPLELHRGLGLRDLKLLTAIDASGTSMLQAVQLACLAVRAGMASRIACVFADIPIRTERGSQASFSRPMKVAGVPGAEAQAGLLGAVGVFGLMTRSYMARHGVSEEAMAHYAIAARRWSVLAPQAMQRGALTLQEYLASPFVVDPIRLLDCAMPVNGAFAVVVGDSGLAARPDISVPVLAMAQGHDALLPPSGDVPQLCDAAAGVAGAVYAQAGIGPSDISSFQCYDAFPIFGLRALEDYGFCAPGTAADFIARGETSPGGSLPMNTGGGHLAGFYLQGVTPLFEALVQLRGEGGERQVHKPGPALVTGVGARYVHHAALLLGPAARKERTNG